MLVFVCIDVVALGSGMLCSVAGFVWVLALCGVMYGAWMRSVKLLNLVLRCSLCPQCYLPHHLCPCNTVFTHSPFNGPSSRNVLFRVLKWLRFGSNSAATSPCCEQPLIRGHPAMHVCRAPRMTAQSSMLTPHLRAYRGIRPANPCYYKQSTFQPVLSDAAASIYMHDSIRIS